MLLGKVPTIPESTLEIIAKGQCPRCQISRDRNASAGISIFCGTNSISRRTTMLLDGAISTRKLPCAGTGCTHLLDESKHVATFLREIL
ncbi:MAG: hypothetical protein ACTSUE_19825 [Promethearchaeota archaeon]